MPRLPVPGQDDGQWGSILNTFLTTELVNDVNDFNNPLNEQLKIRHNGTLTAKYEKPSTGVPKSDLSSGVQQSLDNADAAVAGTIADGSVTTAKLADLAVTDAKVSSSAAIAQSKISNLTSDLAAKAATSAALLKSSNLSDLASSTTARTNLGLGTAATQNVASSGNASTGEVVKGNDTRLIAANGITDAHIADDAISQSKINGLSTSLSAAVPKSTATTKGDLLAATAASTITRLGVGINGYVLTADSAMATGLKWAASSATGTKVSVPAFTFPGVLAVRSGKARYRFKNAGVIQTVAASLDTASAGASVIVDVHKNGTTIFTTQANRPTIAAGSNASSDAAPAVTAVAAGDYITVDVDQIGSTTPGSDLMVLIDFLES